MEKLFGRALSVLGEQWVACSNGVTWKLDLGEVTHRWIIYGLWEGGKGINFAAQVLKDGGVYVDSGCNIGQWLLYLGDIEGVKVIAVEPVTSERNWVGECLENYPDWDVTTFPCGLGKESNTLKIQCDGQRSTLNMSWYAGKNLEKEEVEIRRLDQILRDSNISVVDFWKLDVEGFELEALQGASEILSAKMVRYIWLEYGQDKIKKIQELLNQFDYGLFDPSQLHEELSDCESFSGADLLAIPRS